MAEEKEVKKEFYKLKFRKPIEQKGQTINQNPRLSIDGAIYEVGDVAQLTPERMKSVGEQYFEKLTDKEHKEWIDSGQRKKFLPEAVTNKK